MISTKDDWTNPGEKMDKENSYEGDNTIFKNEDDINWKKCYTLGNQKHYSGAGIINYSDTEMKKINKRRAKKKFSKQWKKK